MKLYILFITLLIIFSSCATTKTIDINKNINPSTIKTDFENKNDSDQPQDTPLTYNTIYNENISPSSPQSPKQNIQEQLKKALAKFSVKKGKVLYNFYPEMIYLILTSKGKITDISLEARETVKSTPVIGDQVGWNIGTGTSGSKKGEITHIYIRPDDIIKETNLIINTNKRVYRFILQSSQYTYMASVEFLYPLQTILKEKTQEEIDKNVKINLNQIHFGYSVIYTGKKYKMPFWVPDRVFDDSEKTFIYIPNITKIPSLPIIFAILNKQTEIINYRIRGNYLIIDGVFQKFIMSEDIDKKGKILIQKE